MFLLFYLDLFQNTKLGFFISLLLHRRKDLLASDIQISGDFVFSQDNSKYRDRHRNVEVEEIKFHSNLMIIMLDCHVPV